MGERIRATTGKQQRTEQRLTGKASKCVQDQCSVPVCAWECVSAVTRTIYPAAASSQLLQTAAAPNMCWVVPGPG